MKRLSADVASRETGIVALTSEPLNIGIWLGLVKTLLAILELAHVLLQVARGPVVPGWKSTIGMTSLLYAVAFPVLGLIGIYLPAIHRMLQQRRRFIVSDGTRGAEVNKGTS